MSKMYAPLPIIPSEYAETIGQICLLWNMAEDTLAYILGFYLKADAEDANALYSVLGNRSRVDLLLYMSGKREKNEETLSKIKYLCKCFDICRENRNILVHGTVRLSAPLEAVDVVKRSSSSLGKFVSFGYNIDVVKQVQSDVENLLWFSSVFTATHLLNKLSDRENDARGTGREPALSLPEIPPLPRKLNPQLPDRQGTPPPPPPLQE